MAFFQHKLKAFKAYPLASTNLIILTIIIALLVVRLFVPGEEQPDRKEKESKHVDDKIIKSSKIDNVESTPQQNNSYENDLTSPH